MRKFSLALFTLLVPMISCWKPISPHPSAFSVSQSYPPLGSEVAPLTRKSSNELFNSDNVDIYVDSFHKNDYIHSQDVSALRHLNDGRNSKALHFESSIFNGIFHVVSKASS